MSAAIHVQNAPTKVTMLLNAADGIAATEALMLVPFLIFSVSSILSPGPANIAASAFGQEVGYRGTLRFLSGMALCFALAMASFGLATESLHAIFPAVSPYLKWAGAVYMAWLAISLFIPSKAGSDVRIRAPSFGKGILMILTNPKLYLFAAALFASFGSSLARGIPSVLALSAGLGAIQFTSASAWALLGVGFSRALGKRGFRKAFTVIMAALLVLSAVLTVIE